MQRLQMLVGILLMRTAHGSRCLIPGASISAKLIAESAKVIATNRMNVNGGLQPIVRRLVYFRFIAWIRQLNNESPRQTRLVPVLDFARSWPL
jgi:hypothetical protein